MICLPCRDLELLLYAEPDQLATAALCVRHPGFQRLFQPGALTLGLILPLETHPQRPAPTMRDHLAMAKRADALGFGALWLLNLTTSVTGLSLGLSWFNAIVIGILGVPGFGLLLLVQWVLT